MGGRVVVSALKEEEIAEHFTQARATLLGSNDLARSRSSFNALSAELFGRTLSDVRSNLESLLSTPGHECLLDRQTQNSIDD